MYSRSVQNTLYTNKNCDLFIEVRDGLNVEPKLRQGSFDHRLSAALAAGDR